MNSKVVFCYVDKLTLGPNLRVELISRRTNLVKRGLEGRTFSPRSGPLRRGEA